MALEEIEDKFGKKLKISLIKIFNDKNEDSRWLNGLFIRKKGETLIISLVHSYFEQWYKLQKKLLLESSIHQICKIDPANISYECLQVMQSKSNHEAQYELADKSEVFTIENFFDNGKNAAPLTAIKQIINLQFQSSLTAFCGKTGTGKTHLLKAIFRELKKLKNCGTNFYNAPNFYSDHKFLFNLIDNKAKCDHQHILIIDNLQDIAADTSIQNTLINFLDLNYEYKNLLIAAWTGTAENINDLDTRLSARITSGLVFELEEPDLEVRLRYIEYANKKHSFGFNKDQLLFLARSAISIPGLQGFIKKIQFFISMQNHTPSFSELERILSSQNPIASYNWQQILKCVAQKFSLGLNDILGTRRKPDLVMARQMAMYICRSKLGLSYPELGRIFGGKDHSTAIHAVKKIQYLRDTNKDINILVTELEKSFQNQK